LLEDKNFNSNGTGVVCLASGIPAKFRQLYGLVPCGLSPDGKTLIAPRDADSFQKYRCPECREPLKLRKSNRRKTHFSHHHMKDSECLLYHSQVTLAKWVLRHVFQQWFAQKNTTPIQISFFFQPPHPIPLNPVYQIKWDQRFRDHTSHLSLHDEDGKALLYIGIIDEAQSPRLPSSRWLEVSAENVLSDPYLLESLNSSMAPPPFLKYEQLKLDF
jgi:hypothetical protein